MAPSDDLAWVAQRHGHDWRDVDALAAVDWLTSLVPREEWNRRSSAVEANFQTARSEWGLGRRSSPFDPSDAVAWYVHQAVRFADPSARHDFLLGEGYRIAPLFTRIGRMLPDLRSVAHAEDRAARLMTEGRSQPDDGIYELLVAGTYRRRGWERVEFVPETPGKGRTPDLLVGRRGTSWAVECKRGGRSGYARQERAAGERMATAVHRLSRIARRPVTVMIRFETELATLPENYLAERVDRFLSGRRPYLSWHDEGGSGGVTDIIWGRLRRVLAVDDVYFGSSRMVELLLGRYDSSIDYSIEGDWVPAEGRPFHADSIDHVSLVAWTSMSLEAARRKAQHFRGVVGRAAGQLPGDRPGVVHVGYETMGGNSVEGVRHMLNVAQMSSFEASDSRLRWVYGNYFMPEQVTARHESAAVTETTAHYRVGRSRTPQPLPGHMLFMDEDAHVGAHFRR